MMKLKNKTVFFLLFFVAYCLNAQNPNWSINRANFEFQMQFTASLKLDENTLTNPNDQVAAFVGNELRGFGNISFDAVDNKYVSFFPVYSNTSGETISFKIYNSVANTVIDAVQTQTFMIDERVGGVFQSFVISNNAVSNEAVLTSFNFQGITALSNSQNENTFTIVLPTGTNLSSLIPVFSASSKAKVFVNFVKQTSGNLARNFSNSVTYQVLSEDEKVLKEYVVNVSIAVSSSNPTVLLSSSENKTTNKKLIEVSVTFSESVSNISVEDFILTNAVISNLNNVNTSKFTLFLTPINPGNFSVTVNQNSVTNIASIGNLASNTLAFIYDDENPIVQNIEHFIEQQYFQITFSEPVLNMSLTNFYLFGNLNANFTLSAFQEISKSIYKISYTGSTTQKGNLFLQLSTNATISDFASNIISIQNSEVFFLNNTDNYFHTTSGNWSDVFNWSLERLPLSKDHLIINAEATTVADVSNFTVHKISNLGKTILPKANNITVNEFSNSGIFTINSDRNTSGSLLVNNQTSGNISFKMMQLLANKWHLIATPIKGQKIKEFAENSENEIRINNTVSPNRYAIGYYNDANTIGNKWEYYTSDVSNTLEFMNGQGYAVSKIADGEILFNGALEIKEIEKTVQPNSWNAIGNPYTTYYPINKNDEQNFLTENSSKLEIPAVYIWDTIQNKYVATTNLVTSKALTIPAGKGFIVKTNSNTTVRFNNIKRTVNSLNTTASKIKNNIPYLKLTIKNNNNIAVTTDVIFSKTATNSFDALEDIPNFEGANFDVNTHLIENSQGRDYTIQSLPFSEIQRLIIPLNLKVSENEEIQFSIETISFPKEVKVFLEDKLTNTVTELSNDRKDHKVTLTKAENGIGRFYLHTSTSVLNTVSNNFEYLNIYTTSNTLYISGLQKEKTEINLFDILGKKVFSTVLEGVDNQKISLNNLSTSTYIVKLITEKGKFVKRVFLEKPE